MDASLASDGANGGGSDMQVGLGASRVCSSLCLHRVSGEERGEESRPCLVLVVHALHGEGYFVLVQPVLCDFSARLDCAKNRPAVLRQLPRPASSRTADMVLFFSSNALGADKPVVIYAGKDKVRSSPARTA